MTRVVARFLWVLAFEATAIGGCNEVTSSNTAPLTLYVFSVNEFMGELVPLEGAHLCQTNTDNCDPSDETGEATIELPIDEDTSFTVVADGHVSALVPVIMPTPFDKEELTLRTNDLMEGRLGRLMVDYPMVDTGAILATRYPYSERATFELESATAVRFYEDEEGWWSLELTATTHVGRGGFVEVPLGDRHTIVAGGTARGCSALWGWPGEEENSYSLPVHAGYLTYLTLLCLQ